MFFSYSITVYDTYANINKNITLFANEGVTLVLRIVKIF